MMEGSKINEIDLHAHSRLYNELMPCNRNSSWVVHVYTNMENNNNTQSELVCQEILTAFPAINQDILLALLQSTDFRFTTTIWLQLCTLYNDSFVDVQVFEVSRKTGIIGCESYPSKHVHVGVPVVFVVSEDSDDNNFSWDLISITSDKREEEIFHVFIPSIFGIHDVKIKILPVFSSSSISFNMEFIADTPASCLAASLDSLLDILFWSWKPEYWTDELEEVIIQLLLAIEDEWDGAFLSLQSVMNVNALGVFSSSLITMKSTLHEDIATALEDHSVLSVGRIHQFLFQVGEMSSFIPLPPSIISGFVKFELIKCSLVGWNVIQVAMREVVQWIDWSLLSLQHTSSQGKGINATGYVSYLNATKSSLLTVLNSITTQQPSIAPLWKLRFHSTALLLSQQFRVGSTPLTLDENKDNGDWHHSEVSFSPVLPIDRILAGNIDDIVIKHTETLTGGALMVGSLLPRSLGTNNEDDIRLIRELLDAGLGYVSSENTLVALHNIERASLVLSSDHPIHHRRLHSRMKDIGRLLRNHKYDSPVSLRINTSFNLIIEKLREHHKSVSWVGSEIENIWRIMFEKMELISFELWYKDELIAADLGHSIRGFCFYVCTRFFDIRFKSLQPGFLLALVETRVLKDIYGFQIWDLGGYDCHPQMLYKSYLAYIMHRASFMKVFNKFRKENDKSENYNNNLSFRKGTAISDIGTQHLLQVLK